MTMETLTLTIPMMVVLGLLGLIIILFAFEILRTDLAALSVMVLLGLLSMVPGLEDISDPMHLFDGFASNAVISIIGVMILGAGLDKTGIMSRVAGIILRIGGTSEKRVVPIVTGTVGVLSGFMQNVGAVAVFVPVASRISARTGIPLSRLLIPLSFCAIMGGTLTLVGTSSTILLNDLLPENIQPFGLFEQTPIGIALLTAGIIYFILAGRFVLPSITNETAKGEDAMAYFGRVYGLGYILKEMKVPIGSSVEGKLVDDLEQGGTVRIIASRKGGELLIRPTRDLAISGGMELAVMGRTEEDLQKFAKQAGLEVRSELYTFSEPLAPTVAGIAEVVIPPDSSFIGKTCQESWMRKSFGLSVLAIHRNGKTVSRDVRVIPLQTGDMLVAHTTWEALTHLEKNPDFVIATSEYPHEELRPHKVQFAALFFAIAMVLVLFSDLRLSLCFLVGAVGMILSGVLSMDEAYESVSWKTIFLLAGLIPIGDAVQDSGTAAWIAQEVMRILGDVPGWVLQAAIAVLATFFTLVMSNVGAAVLLVPLAIGIATTAQAAGIDADPRVFALTVGIAASNSFLLPTHQCNALVMGPGGYQVKDFMKAGGIMTVIFLIVSLIMLNIVF
jgi:di/tricarboxylate transporter